MEQTKSSLVLFTEAFAKETKHLINSTFDINFSSNFNKNIVQMPLFQLSEFSIQSLRNNYLIKIIKKNNHQLVGKIISAKDDDTLIFDTQNSIYHIIKLADLKYIQLAN